MTSRLKPGARAATADTHTPVDAVDVAQQHAVAVLALQVLDRLPWLGHLLLVRDEQVPLQGPCDQLAEVAQQLERGVVKHARLAVREAQRANAVAAAGHEGGAHVEADAVLLGDGALAEAHVLRDVVDNHDAVPLARHRPAAHAVAPGEVALLQARHAQRTQTA